MTDLRRRAHRRRGLPRDVRHAGDHQQRVSDRADADRRPRPRSRDDRGARLGLRLPSDDRLVRRRAALRRAPGHASLRAALRRRSNRSRKAGATTTSTLEEGLTHILAVQSLGGEAPRAQALRRRLLGRLQPPPRPDGARHGRDARRLRARRRDRRLRVPVRRRAGDRRPHLPRRLQPAVRLLTWCSPSPASRWARSGCGCRSRRRGSTACSS